MSTSEGLLFIPGLNCSARLFASQIARLWPFGPITVANHLHGETIAEIAETILDRAPPRFALAGLSMGGYLAFEIMRQAPERVTRLALLDTSARPEAPEQSQKRDKRIALTEAGHFLDTVQEQYQELVHASRHEDEALRSICLQMAEETGPETFIRHSRAIMARPDSRPDLAAIGCPTLVLVGDSDQLTPPDAAREIASGIPGARLVVVPDCGHMSTLEKPEIVNEALISWLTPQQA